ncbi:MULTISPECIES: VTC domain-containing protein [unclassified Pseudoalteromonas]|uniref:VTC domain-containing protein n=1 Tax=unclassified Pseudoalteromonas TaxID=194690 RepID=UPI003080C8BC
MRLHYTRTALRCLYLIGKKVKPLKALVTAPGFFIAELKQSKKTKRSPFYKLMSKHHISPASFSKYCIGCALLYPERLKVNRFKPVLARLKHLNRTNPLLPLENN